MPSRCPHPPPKGSKGLLHSGHRHTDIAVSRVRAGLADVLGTSALQMSSDPSPGTFCPNSAPLLPREPLSSFPSLSSHHQALALSLQSNTQHLSPCIITPERQIQQTAISSCQGLQQTHGPPEAHSSLLPCQVLQQGYSTTRQAASIQPELILWGSSAPASSKAVTLRGKPQRPQPQWGCRNVTWMSAAPGPGDTSGSQV